MIWYRRFVKHFQELNDAGLSALVDQWEDGEVAIDSIDGVPFLKWMAENRAAWMEGTS